MLTTTFTEYETLFNKLEQLEDLSIVSVTSNEDEPIPIEFMESPDSYIVTVLFPVKTSQCIDLTIKRNMLQLLISDDEKKPIQHVQDIIHVLDIDEELISTTVSNHQISLILPKLKLN